MQPSGNTLLPVLLLLVSALEIFLQNFLTGVVAAALFWTMNAGAIAHAEHAPLLA